MLAQSQHRAEALQLHAIKVAGDVPARVLDDVGAGSIGHTLADVAQLASRLEHDAEYL